jgi:hypothetical protein
LTDSVERLTSAISSEGDDTHPDCLDIEIIQTTFDRVGDLVHDLVRKLSQSQGRKAVFSHDNGEVKKALSKAPFLDHIHVYKNNGQRDDDDADVAPPHVDSGLFLLITPSSEEPLQVQ